MSSPFHDSALQQAAREAAAVRAGAGAWLEPETAFIRISGPDAGAWLHAQTTNDVNALASGDGQANAALDRKGRVQAFFTLHRWEDEYWLLTGREQVPALLERFNDYLFLEEVEIDDASGELEVLALQGRRCCGPLAAMPGFDVAAAPAKPYACAPVLLGDAQALAFRVSRTGEAGWLFALERHAAGPALEQLAQAWPGLLKPGPEARDVLRVEAGQPAWGREVDAATRISETPLVHEAVSYDKGCYLGQEVVAKLRTYSSLRRAVTGARFEGSQPPMPGPALAADESAGRVTSAVMSEAAGGPVALAYLSRDCRAPGTRIVCDGVSGVTVSLPFVDAAEPAPAARALYDDAMDRFHADADDTDDAPARLLREAVLLDPSFEDAYEALGVVLHRQGRTDEAIAVMQGLARLAPGCVMAHTNLSVFYVAKGMIQEAEEEKAKAAVLEMEQQRDARRAEELAAEERRRIRAEARERIVMFEEVLAIDPDDSLATYGMGMACLQLDEPARALPFFEKATRLEKDYSAAFLNLGKCHEMLDQPRDARAAYDAGIAAASRKGDLMPLKEMERRRAALPSPDPNPHEGVSP
jgi:folate-binding protein YgfZ